MAEPRIPTMPCPECAGLGSFYDRPEPCEACGETGRVERPPLTPDQVAALPDGARVVFGHAGEDYVRPAEWISRYAAGRPGLRTKGGSIEMRAEFRVWLAEDADV